MSVQTIQSNIERIQRDISSLHRKLTDEARNEAAKTERISQIKRSITSSTSASTLQGKYRDIDNAERDIVNIQKKKADITKQVADKTAELHKYQQELFREQERQHKKMLESFKRREDDAKRRQNDLVREVRLSAQPSSIANYFSDEARNIAYDAFISHATEDKEELVRPLAEALRGAGFSIWYDEFQLKVGHSLRRSIDKGLASSRFGIVVLSSSFFAKNWPQYELDGLVAKEIEGRKVILPLWHKISKNEVIGYSPTLADRVALNTTMFTVEELAKQLGEVLNNE